MNKEIIDFIKYLKIMKNYSDYTCINYQKDLDNYLDFINIKKYDYKNMDYNKCVEYLIYLKDINDV